jgi:aldose 1-epimerase
VPGSMTAQDLIDLSRGGFRGEVTAVINPVGASLEGLEVDSLALIQRFAPGVPRPFYAGVTLAPWPNRIANGQWEWEGETFQLAITDPDRGAALHGFVSDREFSIRSSTNSSLELVCSLEEQPGYPFALEVSVRYDLTDSGIRCTASASNTGSRPAPVALGGHPFVCVGDEPVRSLTLVSPVNREVVVDSRLLPVGVSAVDQDSPEGKVFTLASASLDTTFGMSGPGPWRTILESAGGGRVVVWQDSTLPWLQLFTTDQFPGPQGAVSALAIEPMSAPPHAFVTGEDIRVVAPGEGMSVAWGIDREN